MEHLDLIPAIVIGVAFVWSQVSHLVDQSPELRFGHHLQLGVGQLLDRLIDGWSACSKCPLILAGLRVVHAEYGSELVATTSNSDIAGRTNSGVDGNRADATGPLHGVTSWAGRWTERITYGRVLENAI